MEIRTVRRPGDKGTHSLMQKYGERPICIRYRYDPARRKRIKTVELILGAEDRTPDRAPNRRRLAGSTASQGHAQRYLPFVPVSATPERLDKPPIPFGSRGLWTDPTRFRTTGGTI
jgi:hypothetical protein